MNLTAEWIEKAEEDWRVARRELRVRAAPAYDAICFHSQQCVEKDLKAGLCEANIYFDKTHNRVKLLDQAAAVQPTWAKFRSALQELTTHVVEVRYPGYSADRKLAETSMATCEALRRVLRKHLKLPLGSSLPVRKSRRPSNRKRRSSS